MKRRILLLFVLSLLIPFSIPGCGKEEKAAKKEEEKKQASVKKAKAEKPQKAEQKSEPEMVAYHYNPAGKTDPFRPLVVEESKTGKGMAKKVGSIPPLQRYALDQLKLVGVIANTKPPRALIEDVTGDGFIVLPGMLIGRNEGVVVEIRAKEIVIEEKQLDIYGKLVKKRNILKLREPEEWEEK